MIKHLFSSELGVIYLIKIIAIIQFHNIKILKEKNKISQFLRIIENWSNVFWKLYHADLVTQKIFREHFKFLDLLFSNSLQISIIFGSYSLNLRKLLRKSNIYLFILLTIIYFPWEWYLPKKSYSILSTPKKVYVYKYMYINMLKKTKFYKIIYWKVAPFCQHVHAGEMMLWKVVKILTCFWHIVVFQFIKLFGNFPLRLNTI